MIRWLGSRILWGSLLILAGVMFLLQNLGVFRFGNLFWGVLFLIGGSAFLSIFLQDRAQWWWIIPGLSLLGIGVVIVLTVLVPGLMATIGGFIVLGSIGAAFLIVYLLDQEKWWTLIPAGTMFTLAVVSIYSQVVPGMETGGLFFLGLGLTFALVALLPSTAGRMSWAWIPAGILSFMGLVLFATSGSFIGYLWPLIIIAAGGFLIFRTLLGRPS
ncbi:MAG: hypothetical protein P8Z00_18570 [Anaerolineales bacterium]|jgi:hypothetical protein